MTHGKREPARLNSGKPASHAMKTLILIRHAKSSRDDPFLADRDRPLNKRGKRDAPYMGRLLNERGLVPDAMLSSPAKRALKTAKIVAEILGYPKKKIDIREDIYLQGIGALLELIAGLDDALEKVCLFGHNPDLTEMANHFTDARIDNIPTCGVALLEFDCAAWRECVQAKGRLAWFERPPKPLRDEEAAQPDLTHEASAP
jgi:phosphohistidine phosphatase